MDLRTHQQPVSASNFRNNGRLFTKLRVDITPVQSPYICTLHMLAVRSTNMAAVGNSRVKPT
jgi:hypothetical protein